MGWLGSLRAKWAAKAPFEEEEIVPVDDEDERYIRALACRAADRLSQAGLDMQAETRTTARWLLATLVTLNAGAAIAAANSDRLSVEAIRSSVAAFATGCVLALLTGLSGIVSSMFLGGPLGAAAEAFRFDEASGRIRRASFELVTKFARRSVLLAGFSLLLGLSGIAAFAVGCFRMLN